MNLLPIQASPVALAQRIAQDLRLAIEQQGQAHLCVSGGKSPAPLFQALSQEALAWERVSISLVDERWVAPDHPDRNEHLLQHYLLQHQAQQATLTRLILPNETPELALARLQALNIRPDVCVLGMGEDGHTASLFPDSPNIQEALGSTQDYVLTHPHTAPHQRIGMSLQQILRSRHIYVALSGTKKIAVWQHAAEHPNDARWPISYVLAQHSQVHSYELV